MEEKKSPSIDNQNNKSKWIIAILFLIFIPPIGLYYIWGRRQFFHKKFHLLLWISSGWILSISFIILAMWLPDMKRKFADMELENGMIILSYFDIILPIIILFSILQIIFGFVLDKKVRFSSVFSEKYIIIAMMFLFVTLFIVPITIIFISISANMSLYTNLLI